MEKEFDLHFTPVHEEARAALDLSYVEYALCHYVQYWQTRPGGRVDGWCDRTLEQMAKWIRMTKQGVIKAQKRLIGDDLIEKHPTGVVRITQKWFDAVALAKNREDGKQSLPTSAGSVVNKVYRRGKQSLPTTVNKVDPLSNVSNSSKELKKEKGGFENPDSLSDTKKAPPVAPPPPLWQTVYDWAHANAKQEVKPMCARSGYPYDNTIKQQIQAYCSNYYDRVSFRNDPITHFRDNFENWLRVAASRPATKVVKMAQEPPLSLQAVELFLERVHPHFFADITAQERHRLRWSKNDSELAEKAAAIIHKKKAS